MSSITDARIGTELLGYRIELLVGRGGMGVVYRAFDSRLKRNVALKLLAAEVAADPSFRERFLRESELAASLDHPSVVPIYEAGEADGRLFIAMRFVEGSDLKKRLADGPLEPAAAIDLAMQIAGALDAAHARGLVHRDVKPSNVLIASGAGTGGSDHVYLSDFGLTRRLAEPAGAPGSEPLMATIDYVAPEQIRGEEVDGRADVYSFGCLLYECLAGEPPFRASSDAALLFAHLEGEPPRLSERGFPAAIDPVIGRALAKRPDDRYATARELVDDAREALGIARPLARDFWRTPALIALAGVALLSAGALAYTLTRSTGVTPSQAGADLLVQIEPSTNKAVGFLPVGRQAVGLAADRRHVWVANAADRTLMRIDPQTKTLIKLPTQETPVALAISGGKVVVAHFPEHGVAWYDSTGALIDNISLPGDTGHAVQVSAGPGNPWLADPGEGIVGAVDDALSSGAPGIQIGVPADNRNLLTSYRSFDSFATGARALWLTGDSFQRTVWRFDLRTKRLAATIRLSFIPDAIAAGAGAVWVTSLLGDTVSRIDPATNRITSTIKVGRGPDAVAVGAGSVWVTSAIDGTVSRVDPRTNQVTATIPVGGRPEAITVGVGAVWVTVRKSPAPASGLGIKIGVLSDCTGGFSGITHDLNIAGVELALLQRGGKLAGTAYTDGVNGVSIGGRPVRLIFGCGDGTGTTALREARRLVESAGVDILVGPVAGEEATPLQEYARLQPRVAFINGSAGVALPDPAPNFFNFSPDGAQQMAGLASYAYHTLKWRHAAIVSYLGDPFYWAQAAGFSAEFCSLGGTIAKRVWLPQSTTDLSGLGGQIPQKGVDGIVVASSADAVIALAHSYPGLAGHISRRMVIGFAVSASQLVPQLWRLGPSVTGLATAASGYINAAGDPPPGLAYNQRYMKEFLRSFPRIPSYMPGSWFDVWWYTAMSATLRALDQVHGNLADGERTFMAALAHVRLDMPGGRVALDAKHRVTRPNYIFVLVAHGRSIRERIIRTVPNVEATFGGYFTSHDPPPSATTPVCRKGHVPSWARSG